MYFIIINTTSFILIWNAKLYVTVIFRNETREEVVIYKFLEEDWINESIATDPFLLTPHCPLFDWPGLPQGYFNKITRTYNFYSK